MLIYLQALTLECLNELKRPIKHLLLLLILINQITVVNYLALILLSTHGLLRLCLCNLNLTFNFAKHLFLHLLDAHHEIMEFFNLAILNEGLFAIYGGVGTQTGETTPLALYQSHRIVLVAHLLRR